MATRHHCRYALMTPFLLIAVLAACGGADDADEPASGLDVTDRNAAPAEAARPSPEPVAEVARISLFSEPLHDLAIPDPGRVRIEAYGQVHEVALMADCSAPTEPPPADEDFAQHRFQVHISWEMEDQHRVQLSLLRAIALDEERLWRAQGHENENVNLQVRTQGARPETLDQRFYNLRRNRPEDTPSISRNHRERPQAPGPEDEVPGIRVHPDGRRATFVGLLGTSETPAMEGVRDLEEVRIAVHCGPPSS